MKDEIVFFLQLSTFSHLQNRSKPLKKAPPSAVGSGVRYDGKMPMQRQVVKGLVTEFEESALEINASSSLK